MEWKRQEHSCITVVPQKLYPIPDQNTHTDLAGTYLYGVHKGVPLPSGMLDITRHHQIGSLKIMLGWR